MMYSCCTACTHQQQWDTLSPALSDFFFSIRFLLNWLFLLRLSTYRCRTDVEITCELCLYLLVWFSFLVEYRILFEHSRVWDLAWHIESVFRQWDIGDANRDSRLLQSQTQVWFFNPFFFSTKWLLKFRLHAGNKNNANEDWTHTSLRRPRAMNGGSRCDVSQASGPNFLLLY